MPLTHYETENADVLTDLANELYQQSDFVFLYFTAKKDENDSAWTKLSDSHDIVLNVYCSRREWKKSVYLIRVNISQQEYINEKCEYRKKPFYINSIPTLTRWAGPQRLEGDDCASNRLLDEFFSEYEEGYTKLIIWDFENNQPKKNSGTSE